MKVIMSAVIISAKLPVKLEVLLNILHNSCKLFWEIIWCLAIFIILTDYLQELLQHESFTKEIVKINADVDFKKYAYFLSLLEQPPAQNCIFKFYGTFWKDLLLYG